jgi:hypothetical protein
MTKKVIKKTKTARIKCEGTNDIKKIRKQVEDLHSVMIYNEEEELPTVIKEVKEFVATTHELTFALQDKCMKQMVEAMQQMQYMKKLTLVLIDLCKKKGCEVDAVKQEAETIFDQAAEMNYDLPESKGAAYRKELASKMNPPHVCGTSGFREE